MAIAVAAAAAAAAAAVATAQTRAASAATEESKRGSGESIGSNPLAASLLEALFGTSPAMRGAEGIDGNRDLTLWHATPEVHDRTHGPQRRYVRTVGRSSTVGCIIGWLVGWLVHSVVGSLVRWFVGSLVRSFVRAPPSSFGSQSSLFKYTLHSFAKPQAPLRRAAAGQPLRKLQAVIKELRGVAVAMANSWTSRLSTSSPQSRACEERRETAERSEGEEEEAATAMLGVPVARRGVAGPPRSRHRELQRGHERGHSRRHRRRPRLREELAFNGRPGLCWCTCHPLLCSVSRARAFSHRD